MTHFYAKSAAVISFLILGTTIGCGGSGTTSETRAVSTSPRLVGELSFVLSSPRSVYKRGENILYTLSVRNTGRTDVTVSYIRRLAAFGIYNPSGTLEYELPVSADATVRTETFAPGETRNFSQIRSQDPVDAGSLPAGQYKLAAWLNGNTATPTNLAPELLPIRISE